MRASGSTGPWPSRPRASRIGFIECSRQTARARRTPSTRAAVYLPCSPFALDPSAVRRGAVPLRAAVLRQEAAGGSVAAGRPSPRRRNLITRGVKILASPAPSWPPHREAIVEENTSRSGRRTASVHGDCSMARKEAVAVGGRRHAPRTPSTPTRPSDSRRAASRLPSTQSRREEAGGTRRSVGDWSNCEGRRFSRDADEHRGARRAASRPRDAVSSARPLDKNSGSTNTLLCAAAGGRRSRICFGSLRPRRPRPALRCRRGPASRAHVERRAEAAIVSNEGTLRDTSTSCKTLGALEPTRARASRARQDGAREVAALRHGEPVGVVAAAAPRPRKPRRRASNERPRFSLSFSPSRHPALSSSSRAQLGRIPQSEGREGAASSLNRARYSSPSSTATSDDDVGSWRYVTLPCCASARSSLSAPRSFRTPGT